MKPDIYIDGQPFEGIGELRAEHIAEPDNPPEVVRVNSIDEAVSLSNILRKATVMACFPSLEMATKAFQELAEAMARLPDIEVERPAINPRWYHLSKYARKARTRKKYLSRIDRERKRAAT